MKYNDVGFRAVYHHFAVFPLSDATRNAIKDFPGEKTAEGILTYGYYDREAGMTLEVLGCARRHDEFWQFADSNNLIRSFIRIDAVADDDFGLFMDEDGKLAKRYSEKLEVLKAYDPSEEIEKSRTFGFLDDTRHPQFIDDVQVIFQKDGLKQEACWARIIDLSDRRIWAKLLNEPDQDFGIHEGEDFTFYVQKDEETGKVTCHAQFSPLQKMKPEDFEDGSLMRDAIHRFHEDSENDALFELLQILRDSYVWIPCNAIVGEEDQKTVEQMIEEAGDNLDSMIGKEFTTQGNIRMVPDILQKDDQYFFPVFSTEEDMGEYGERFSKLQEHFLQVIKLARDNKKYEGGLTGIVINAFTEPFILPKELYEAVEKMVSRIE